MVAKVSAAKTFDYLMCLPLVCPKLFSHLRVCSMCTGDPFVLSFRDRPEVSIFVKSLSRRMKIRNVLIS